LLYKTVKLLYQSATNCREYLILNMGVLCPPMHKRLKFFGYTTGPLTMWQSETSASNHNIIARE